MTSLILSITIEQLDAGDQESFAFKGVTPMPMGLPTEGSEATGLTLDEAAARAQRHLDQFCGTSPDSSGEPAGGKEVSRALEFIESFCAKLNAYRGQSGRDSTRRLTLSGWPDDPGTRIDQRGFGAALDTLDARTAVALRAAGANWATRRPPAPLGDSQAETLGDHILSAQLVEFTRKVDSYNSAMESLDDMTRFGFGPAVDRRLLPIAQELAKPEWKTVAVATLFQELDACLKEILTRDLDPRDLDHLPSSHMKTLSLVKALTAVQTSAALVAMIAVAVIADTVPAAEG